MLTELRFENFKSWKDTGVMRMAPLTGFFGTNSSGKTAILQFLLMLKQTVESNDQSQVLNFGNEHSYVDLGTVRSFLHKQKIPQMLQFSLKWDRRSNQLPIIMLPSDYLEVLAPPLEHRGLTEVPWMKFFASVQFEVDSIAVEQMVYAYPSSRSEIINQVRLNKRGNGYFLEGTGAASRFSKVTGSPSKVYGFPSETFVEAWWRKLDLSFEYCFEDLYYLGPIREYPKRFYGWSGETSQDVGRRGENTIAALLTARKQDPEIEIKIAHWLKVMGLIDDFKVDLIAPEQRLYQASVRIAPGGTYCPITDVGFGVSQILPVLVLCYYVPKGSTIIFEQPEIHLHPSAQQKLADVFIDVIKHRELQIIIESHSEHLLHRLQRRIAEEELAPEQAALYFCQMENDGASSLTSLELDEFGNITNWPEDFFGNEMEDLVAMTEAAMQRSMDTEAA
jgi:predicted ATPase